MDPGKQVDVLSYVKAHLDSIIFKPLHVGEQELTDSEKLQKMGEVLHEDPGLFLSKWGRYLSQDALRQFEGFQDYEVTFHLHKLLQYDSPAASPPPAGSRRPKPRNSRLHTLVHNRRYEYLKRHLRASSYFEDETMQLRAPVLYEQYIGQYISEAEKTAPFASDVNLVQRILKDIDRDYVNEQVKMQKGIDEEQFEEEEEEDEDDAMEESETPIDTDQTTDEKGKKVESISTFQQSQRDEFVRLMEERFLDGQDTDFDYSVVDYNEAYDDLDEQERDIQERYFDRTELDDETPPPSSIYTGQLDY
ncbi:hypothetical protein DFQ28_008005 [Apophysomyces sp. BC1034]|nr:hypothetical protein DFQ30_007275 [Apophysomyces sp. BC1015]KAG0182064.1 hypothetical protein DFQ29_005905 [Apophysomyces sp. BC1021]KAG0192761.1 hypothetical protein DFQ28_008005 [Apophysomyces sp. BC1034]